MVDVVFLLLVLADTSCVLSTVIAIVDAKRERDVGGAESNEFGTKDSALDWELEKELLDLFLVLSMLLRRSREDS